MNIVFFTHLANEFPLMIEVILKKFPQNNFIFARTKEEYKKAIKDAHILIYGNPSDYDIENSENLKFWVAAFNRIGQ